MFWFSFVGEFGNFREKSRIPQHVFSGMKEMNMAVRHAEKQIPPGPHWKFCYKTIRNDFTIIALILHQFDLDLRNAEVIEDVIKKMGAGMAKFICKEIETIDDYDEYCHYVAGLVGLGLSKLFQASGIEDLPPGTFFHASSVFLQKADVILDYLEDINETPKPRILWLRQIWSKYTDRLEDLKYEKNSIQALHCLNDMVTNALIHAEDCLKDISAVRDPVIFRSFAGVQAAAIWILACCYNNIQVFRGVETLTHGLTPELVEGTKTISNFHRHFHKCTCMLKSKIDDSDPNAAKTRDRVESILKTLEGIKTVKTKGGVIPETIPRGLVSKEKRLLISEFLELLNAEYVRIFLHLSVQVK
ncbi:squalene synthase [Olea europaea subsp. europaea]|uniref:Squalene synthase n=1 Tax=Olea europaea subsp. europaea TaxID=158383 RepID=A0A8S0QAX6_OLEEU|nr:squalene synthase [Olea europaea subsp. europaea]